MVSSNRSIVGKLLSLNAYSAAGSAADPVIHVMSFNTWELQSHVANKDLCPLLIELASDFQNCIACLLCYGAPA